MLNSKDFLCQVYYFLSTEDICRFQRISHKFKNYQPIQNRGAELTDSIDYRKLNFYLGLEWVKKLHLSTCQQFITYYFL